MAAKTKKEDALTIEAAFDRIERRIEELQAEDISLENAFAKYQEGMELVRYCSGAIDQVEKKVMKLSADGGLSGLEEDADAAL